MFYEYILISIIDPVTTPSCEVLALVSKLYKACTVVLPESSTLRNLPSVADVEPEVNSIAVLLAV
jgi:hypothetical protein|tara:strand:+ start:462 stop:656 length:195 start_codon:yes stop_codon:yes gene_type:complete